MTPTRPARLVVPFALVAALALLLSRLAGDDALPALPLPAVLAVTVLALVELPLASSVRARLAGRPGTRPILPLTVARVAALAQASSLTAALAGGAWLGLLADRLLRLGDADAVRVDVAVAASGVLTAALLLVAGLRLEGVCRVQGPPDR